MATTTNFLSYSGLTYEDIVTAINKKIKADPRFSNYNDTQIAALINQILAATTDFTNYLMDNCFNENFFETAQLKSSVIGLSRNLGYSIQRPIPATAKMQVKLFGDYSGYGFAVGDTLQIPLHSKFSYGDFSYILQDSLYIPITSQMLIDFGLGADYSQIITVDYKGSDITLIEGTIKEKIITGTNNPLVASPFQLYKISDTTFSNLFADTDLTNEVTQVYCGVGKDRKYIIDKRSVINWENFTEADFENPNDICVIRTGSDEGVELLFGDGVFADIGAKTTAESVWISYLSTKGATGNQTGLIGEKITYSGKVYSSTDADLTGKVEFQFKTNPVGGANLESIDSIKMNAPSIYYSLDRLVTESDYVNYLKSLTSPISVKNALAWGEQAEIRKHVPVDTSDIKMFNTVFFTVLGSLYNLTTSPYSPRDTGTGLDLAVLDSNYNEDEVPIRGFFNMYIRQDQVDQFKEYTATTSYWNYQGIATSATSGTDLLGAKALGTTYGSNAQLEVSYASKTTETTLVGTSALTINVSDMNTFSSLTSAMNTIASRITTALITIVDARGLVATNESKGQVACSSIVCTYDPSATVFIVSASSNDPCYLYSIDGSFANDIGLSGRTPSQVLQTTTDYIAENIVTVRNSVQERAQITVNSVYLSPIIHTFDLSGTVYVSPLFDINTVKTEIEDNLYSFFDLNADFNVPVYKSNIVEIVEANAGVKFCDVGFVETYSSRADGQSYATVEKQKPIYATWGVTTFLSVMQNSINAQHSYTGFTERQLLSLFKDWYDLGITYGFTDFLNSNDFLNWLTALRKDNVRYIRNHLINTYGNIGEGILQSDNITTFYAYSVGTEIVKIKSILNYSYKG